jgi:hypothetical protein
MTKTKINLSVLLIVVALIAMRCGRTTPDLPKDEDKAPTVGKSQPVIDTLPVADTDSVFLAILSENNFVQILGEDDMPVISFQLPEGEPLSEQLLTPGNLTIDYSLSSSPGFLCRFEFRMIDGKCDFTRDQTYGEWRNRILSNIHFTRGIGRADDVMPYQSQLYAFDAASHCLTFGITFHPLSDTTNLSSETYNELEGINLIESTLKSIMIY